MAYDRYACLAYSLFFHITRNQSSAEDLIQELFMRVWTHARRFDSSKGSLGVWILSVARNMAIDHLRSAHARFTMRLRPVEILIISAPVILCTLASLRPREQRL
ncbi:MAG: RNA polymerase sigma factor [Bryobacteraceae bacterium]